VGTFSLALFFLIAAITLVPLSKKIGLGSILGYLIAGIILGPSGFKLIDDVDALLHFAEFGVVMLLFIIGLELKPSKLWTMRKELLGLGLAQFALTTLALTPLLIWFGFSVPVAILIGSVLSLSSTAFALQTLAEKNELKTTYGQKAFSILLFQDIIAIPLLAVVPFLSSQSTGSGFSFLNFVKIIGVFTGLIVFAKFAMSPLMRLVANSKTREVFTALTLLIVLGVSFLMQQVGLSMALGAFIAGILLSDSEYRHQIETDVEPFKGLLLGLFFIAIGMTVNFNVLLDRPAQTIGAVMALVLIKYLVVYFIGRRSDLNSASSQSLGVILAQGGEFAFVVFASAFSLKILNGEDYNLLIVVVTSSMAVSALIGLALDQFRTYLQARGKQNQSFDKIESDDTKVIIAGFGRVGQIPGRLLRSLGIKFTALELDPEQVDVVRKFGNKIFYGDASRLDLLESAGAHHAKVLILAIDDVDVSVHVATLVRERFPKLEIFARARNRSHVFRLRDIGVKHIWRETFSSSLELSKGVLTDLGFNPEKVKELVEIFCRKDSEMLEEQYKVHHSQDEMIATSRQGAAQLDQLMSEKVQAPNMPPT